MSEMITFDVRESGFEYGDFFSLATVRFYDAFTKEKLAESCYVDHLTDANNEIVHIVVADRKSRMLSKITPESFPGRSVVAWVPEPDITAETCEDESFNWIEKKYILSK